MKNLSNKRKKILDQPAYWIEGINQEIFHHLVDYMEKNNLNKTQMAKKNGNKQRPTFPNIENRGY